MFFLSSASCNPPPSPNQSNNGTVLFLIIVTIRESALRRNKASIYLYNVRFSFRLFILSYLIFLISYFYYDGYHLYLFVIILYYSVFSCSPDQIEVMLCSYVALLQVLLSKNSNHVLLL